VTNRNIALPEEGVYFNGPRPYGCEVREVPEVVSDADLTAFVAEICATRQGLMLGQGDGYAGTHYSVHFKSLLGYARERGIETPQVPERPKPQGRRYFTAEGETNEHGQLLHPRHAAPARAERARPGEFVEV
jgi:hypothetical protein